MDDPFLFVDESRTGPASRKQIRRHVMKGRNAGKTIHRTSKLSAIKPHHVKSGLRVQQHDREQGSSMVLGNPDSGLVNVLRTLSLPVEITAESMLVIDEFFNSAAERVYPVRLGISLEEAKREWLQILLIDESMYHCHIAIMRACNDMLKGHTHSSQALQHLSRTFSYVKKIIGSEAALSDSSIAIVLSLIIQEQLRNHAHDAAVHARGLARMVELRGGLENLEHNQALVLKICKIDVIYAIQLGGPTMYFRHRWPDLPVPPTLVPAELDMFHADLQSVYHDTRKVCFLFNELSYTMELHTFEEVTSSLAYRLLRFRYIKAATVMIDKNSILHLGLLLVAMTTSLQYGGRQIMEFPLITTYLARVLRSDHFDLGSAKYKLWLCIMSGIWLPDHPERDLARSKVFEVSATLSLKTWADVQEQLQDLPWIEVLHDGPGLNFWEWTQKT